MEATTRRALYALLAGVAILALALALAAWLLALDHPGAWIVGALVTLVVVVVAEVLLLVLGREKETYDFVIEETDNVDAPR